MAQYGRWIDIDGNLHYFDTEKGEVVEEKEKESEVRYKIYIDPMPKTCYDCPMYVYKGWDDYEDYCHLDGSIYKGRKYDPIQEKYFYSRPDDCPLCERAKGKWIVKLKFPNRISSAISNCSNCGCESKTWRKYCPDCGAEMENGGEE